MGGVVGERVGEAPLCRWRELSMLCGLQENTEPQASLTTAYKENIWSQGCISLGRAPA